VQAPRFATNGVLRRGPRIKKKLGRSGIILHSGRIYHLRQNKEILGPDMTPGKRFEVAGFESRGYLAFIVSDLDLGRTTFRSRRILLRWWPAF